MVTIAIPMIANESMWLTWNVHGIVNEGTEWNLYEWMWAYAIRGLLESSLMQSSETSVDGWLVYTLFLSNEKRRKKVQHTRATVAVSLEREGWRTRKFVCWTSFSCCRAWSEVDGWHALCETFMREECSIGLKGAKWQQIGPSPNWFMACMSCSSPFNNQWLRANFPFSFAESFLLHSFSRVVHFTRVL